MEQVINIRLNDDDNLTLTHQNISEYIKYFQKQNHSNKDKIEIFINLFKESLSEVERFTLNRTDLTLTSLHVRSIFELFLIINHINSDSKGLDHWCSQLHRDMSDINKGSIKKMGHIEGIEEKINKSQAIIDENFKDTSYPVNVPFFNMSNLAKEYGLEADYLFVYKLCSKLIHPTSLKINGLNSESKDIYLKILIQIGVNFCIKLEDLIKKVIGNK